MATDRRDPKTKVFMRHKVTNGVAEATLEALDAVWREKGWEEDAQVDAAQVEHERRLREIIGPDLTVEGLKDATKLTLIEVAGQLGRSVPKRASRKQVAQIVSAPVSPEDGTTTTAVQGDAPEGETAGSPQS